MKPFFTICAIGIAELAIAASLGARPALAGPRSSSFHGPNGNFAGSSITRGNSTSFYDSNGHFTGSSIAHGRETTFYDKAGHFQGSVIQQGTPSNPLTGK